MSNLNELKPVGNLSPFARFCCTIGNLPSSYMVSLTYEEQLLWLCDYLKNTVIPAVNTNAEAVKELQELYVKLKNYVDNYFNNLDVQNEINNKLDKMAEDGTLEKIINNDILNNLKNNIKNIYSNNSFKPTVFASMYMIDHTTEVIKNRILKWKEMQCKGVIVLINLNNDNNLTVRDDLNKVKELMNFAKDNNLIVNTIKFHCNINNMISTDILSTYENQVNYVLNELNAKDFGITRITLFNELDNLYAFGSEEIKNKGISIINNFKNLGYEVGITTSNLERGIGFMIHYSPNIANVVDFLAFNYYQVFPFKKELTNNQDSIFAWSNSLNASYNYKKQFPNKKIIMSETGCLDNWLNMMNPSDYTLNKFPANGKTYPVYFYGLFKNAVANTNLSELWLWYDEVLTNYDDVIQFFKYFLGGNIDE